MNGTTADEVFASANGIPLSELVEGGDAANFALLAPGAERHQHQMQYAAQQQYHHQQHHHQQNVAASGNNMNGGGMPGPSGLKSKHPVENSGKLVMDYSTDFPMLPDAPASAAPAAAAWGRRPAPVAGIKSTEITEAFKLSANERASRGLGKQFGNSSEEQQKCNQIANQTGAKIELCEAKDQSLTILITGKRPNVEEARTRLVRELQTQATMEVDIPKDYHGMIIGREGSKLRQMEKDYLCRIYMPGRDEKTGVIRISGPNEYIVECARRIKEIGDEMAKQGNESLAIPREFYPWIRGAFNQTLDNIIAQTGARVNIPPSSSRNETIVITGEKSGVERAAAEIKRIYASKKDVVKTLTCKVPKAQHRFVIGTKRSSIDEILRDHDCVVEVPPEDDESESITIRGHPSQLGDALAQVYSKASSTLVTEIKYPEWMRRFLIGPKGSTLHSLVPNQDKLKLEFESGGVIYLEGPPDVVKSAHHALSQEIARLNKEMSSQAVKVPHNLHRHIIGRNGALVNKLKEEHDVQITIPHENTNSDEIRVEGKNEGVKKTMAAIQEIVKRLENEKSRDIIIEHRFHASIIGRGGENMKKWRHEFPTVSISFPEATEKSDVVNLRGDKKEVDALHAVLTKLTKELIESNHQDSVPIFKEYYKHIVGKGGVNINKIREETQTRIELPSQNEQQRITVVGKKANVEKAIAQLNKIQNELASIVSTEVQIASRIHSRLLANGRRLIRDIEDEFGGVHILFPKEKSSDVVTIRGPKDDVAKAEKTLKEVAKHCEQTTEEVTISTKPEYVKFLIGRDGANVKKLREKYPSVRVVFSGDSDKDSQIVLVGKKEEVETVKGIYEKQITDLKETVEVQVDVDPKWHRHFVTKGAEVLKEIASHNGNVQISFPRQDSGDSKVTIKGSKSCAESAKHRIEEIVDDLAHQITIDVNIPAEHHRSLMAHLNNIRSQYSVRIKVPDHRNRRNDEENGDHGDSHADIIQISGRENKVEEAKQALLALIPITKTISVPLAYHRAFIGRGGEAVRALMQAHAVRIKIPSAEEQSEEIAVTGLEENIESTFAEIRSKIAELDRQSEDQKLRSFKIAVEVPPKYHQRLIGPGGSKVREISARHDVQISFPKSDANTAINVTGYEDKCNACKEEIEQLVEDWESMIHLEVALDARFHPRLIGARGKNLRKIEEDYGVEIRMPNRKDPNPDVVVISGKNEEAVYDCADKLRADEEDYITDLVDRGRYLKREEPQKEKPVPQKEVQITGAPWQLNDTEHFPSISSAPPGLTPAANTGGGGAWGKGRSG